MRDRFFAMGYDAEDMNVLDQKYNNMRIFATSSTAFKIAVAGKIAQNEAVAISCCTTHFSG